MTLSKEERSKRHQEGSLKRTQANYDKTHKIIDGILYKQCSCHKELFPDAENDWFPCTEEFFYHNKANTRDGLNTWCKECSKIKATKWIKANPDKYKEVVIKTEARPERIKKKRVRANKQLKEGYHKQYQETHLEKFREYSKKRGQKNHKINKKEWKSCLNYFNNQCAYCGMSLDEHKRKYKEQLHKEHVDHLGSNDLSNCIPSCKSCNSHKSEQDMEKWYKEQEYFTQERLNKINKWLKEDYKLYYIEKKPKKPYGK